MDGRCVVVLYSHWWYHNSTDFWLAGFSFWGNASDAWLTVLVGVCNVAFVRKRAVCRTRSF